MMTSRSEHPLLQRPLYGMSSSSGVSAKLWALAHKQYVDDRRYLTSPAAFDLPRDIVSSLELRADLNNSTPTPANTRDPRSLKSNGDQSSPSETPEGAPSNATSCGTCGQTFTSLQEQREHVRSDLHAYNLKQKLRGRAPVDEKEFERLVAGESLRWPDMTKP